MVYKNIIKFKKRKRSNKVNNIKSSPRIILRHTLSSLFSFLIFEKYFNYL